MATKDNITPVLIREDQLEYNTDLHRLNHWIKPHFSKIEKAFAYLDIGPLSDEYLKDILFGSLSKTKEALRTQIQEEVTSRFLQGEANRKVQSLIGKLSETYEALDDTLQRIVGLSHLLRYLSVDERGKITISEKSKAELLETHRTYVSTPDGITRYKLHLKAVKAMNEFKNAMGSYLGNADIFNCFDIGEDDNVKVVPFDYE